MTSRRVFLLSFVMLATVGVSARQRTYTFRCPECGRVEQYTDSNTRYCYGPRDKPHLKRTMQRVDEVPANAHQYECPTCKRVEIWEGGGSRYCTGTDRKPHAKVLMRRLDQ